MSASVSHATQCADGCISAGHAAVLVGIVFGLVFLVAILPALVLAWKAGR